MVAALTGGEQEVELQVAEFKILLFTLGETRMDRIRNEHVRKTTQVVQFRDMARLRWRKDAWYVKRGDGC